MKNKKTTVNANEFQECIRHMNCLNEQAFNELFGSEYYWDKFYNQYERNVGKFICSLDLENMRVLFNHFLEFLQSQKGK